MLSRSGWSGLVTDIDSSASYPLGTLRESEDGSPGQATAGAKVFRYVKNAEAATAFAVGNVIQRKASTDSMGDGIVCATTDVYEGAILGVAVSAIPAGSYGWVQVKGRNASLVTDGNVAAGDPVGSHGGTLAGSVYTVTKGLGTDFAYAPVADTGTVGTVILNIAL